MTEKFRKECTPREYIRKLFEETKDGTLKIKYYPFIEQPYSLSYRVDWTKQDAERVEEHYASLSAALAFIGAHHTELADEAKRKALLQEEQLRVWDAFEPFEAFEVEENVIAALFYRAEYDSLDEEENELLERHHYWFVENSRRRLPYNGWCPSGLINRAQRYEKLVELGAPKVVVEEEGRSLAEEMVLYFHGIPNPNYNLVRFAKAQERTYCKALEEIKEGKKKSHWMWFIFPQLCGLGKSETAKFYAISGLDEAKAYLNDTILGSRLIEITAELVKLEKSDPKEILGEIDAMKLKSSLTLFAYISEEGSVFHKALQKFFGGQTDARTLALLSSSQLGRNDRA